MTAYATEGWGEMFLCAGGATAALSGLIFVGLSVNIHTVLAAFILLTAAGSAISPSRALQASRGRALSSATLLRLATATALTLTLLAAGVTLAAGHGGGLYWLPAAFVLAITVAAVNAWVLLVEACAEPAKTDRASIC